MLCLSSATPVGLTSPICWFAESAESKHIRPKKAGCLHFLLPALPLFVLVAVTSLVCVFVFVTVVWGGGVIVWKSLLLLDFEECLCLRSGSSQQPKNRPGVLHVSASVVDVCVGVEYEDKDVVVMLDSHPPPNQPGLQDALAVVEAGTDEVVVGASTVVVIVRFADSLHPNQPGCRHVVVVYVVVTTGRVDDGRLVVSSKQPHQPGVLQVDVLVKDVLEAVVVVVVVVLSDPLLSKNFQL